LPCAARGTRASAGSGARPASCAASTGGCRPEGEADAAVVGLHVVMRVGTGKALRSRRHAPNSGSCFSRLPPPARAMAMPGQALERAGIGEQGLSRSSSAARAHSRQSAKGDARGRRRCAGRRLAQCRRPARPGGSPAREHVAGGAAAAFLPACSPSRRGARPPATAMPCRRASCTSWSGE
jgi:hypothetical protein